MTANKNVDSSSSSSSSQGDGGGTGGGASAVASSAPPPPPPPGAAQPGNLSSPDGNTVLKSGPLFISSKGIGWTSWKKRWFILKRTSLVFFRSDPSAAPPKGGEVNLTLGGIDLNNSGSVVVKPDKKLLTVLFPDGRAFTLKAETLEDLNDWKTALENALAQAPTAALGMGQNGILKNEQADGTNVSSEKSTEKQPTKSLVIGRPILLALEEVDGSPSFLEKALRFIEEHGVKVEGILRQAADVDDVEHRIREFEQGKTEFSPEEDAHVIGDCVKYFLRELPSSPVPASCCNALLEACRNDRGNRVNAMRAAILETFPEPNRRLLQRILLMMKAVASHKAENRMSNSAVAACMAPLLLRPLLAGDCEIETDVNVGGDGSIQLLKAAAAANHAQAIVITLLDEYEKIFSEGAMAPGLYSDSEDCDSEDEEYTDDDEYYEDEENDDGMQESDVYTDDDLNASSGTYSRSGDSCEDDDLSDNKGSDDASYSSRSPKVDSDSKIEQKPSSSSVQTSVPQNDDVERNKNILVRRSSSLAAPVNVSGGPLKDASEGILDNNSDSPTPLTCMRKSTTLSNGPTHGGRRTTVWGRTPAKKNLSMESIDLPLEDEVEIEKLEATKMELQNRINEEVKTNAVLQTNLEQRRKALHERRLSLEQDVLRLQEQLQKEKEKRAALEAGLYSSRGPLSIPVTMDEKTKADLMEMSQAEADITNLKQRADNLSVQLNQPHEQKYGSMQDSSNQPLDANNQVKRKDKQKDKPKDTEVSVNPPGKSASKDTCMDGAPSENEKKHDSTSGSKKQTANKKQLDPASSGNSRSISSNSKRSSSRNEGTNSTISALTKLTTRLNFLKERRSQIASELQNPDKDKASPQAARNPDKGGGSESHQSIRTTDESQGTEVHSVQNSEKGSGPEGSQSLQIPNKGSGAEGQSQRDSERSRNLNSESLKNQDEEKNQEQQPQNLNKGRSEGPVSSDADKVKGSGGRPAAPSWTNSR